MSVIVKYKEPTEDECIKINPAKSDSIILQVNKSFASELGNSLVLETTNSEIVESVSLIVEGLRFDKVLIRGISSTLFLALFYLEDNLDSLDLDFLESGFKKVTKAKCEDIVPTRKTWIECRGLPATLWLESNFESICHNIWKDYAILPYIR